jgi:hypothetical protein
MHNSVTTSINTELKCVNSTYLFRGTGLDRNNSLLKLTETETQTHLKSTF